MKADRRKVLVRSLSCHDRTRAASLGSEWNTVMAAQDLKSTEVEQNAKLTLTIHQPDGDSTDESSARRACSDLELHLLDVAPHDQVSRTRTESDTQDVGTVLSLVLTSGATLAVAEGIRRWLEQRTNSSVTVKTRDGGCIEVKNVSNRSAQQLAVELASLFKRRKRTI